MVQGGMEVQQCEEEVWRQVAIMLMRWQPVRWRRQGGAELGSAMELGIRVKLWKKRKQGIGIGVGLREGYGSGLGQHKSKPGLFENSGWIFKPDAALWAKNHGPSPF